MKKLLLFVLLLTGSVAGAWAQSAEIKKEQQEIYKKLGRTPEFFKPWKSESMRWVILDKVELSADRKTLKLFCNIGLSQIPIRYELLEEWEKEVLELIGDKYDNTSVKFYTYDNLPIEQFIPNYYRPKEKRDEKRTSTPVNRRPLVRRADQSVYGLGLNGRHIALWSGHGKLYHGEDSLWKWQRPALFCTIEDLHTAEYVNTYLAPMLENAGAVVILPRERDTQPREIIADNDLCTGNARIETIGEWEQTAGGFKWADTLREQNPFQLGSYLQTDLEKNTNPEIIYHLNITDPGTYGVYVSWKAAQGNLSNAKYTVHHAGGKSEFEVNQTIGGSMWVWLGSFELNRASKVILSAPEGTKRGKLTADAVKVGGGMGNILRGYDDEHMEVSGVPRYAEAARYWLQYSGVTDKIYAQDTKGDKNKTDKKQLDYSDSFKATGNWCTYLKTNHNIPMDLAIGLHTDAGICDSILGTLAIYYTNKTKAQYKNNKSKMAGRDFADLVQTQIVEDIRAKYDPEWTRRALYDKSYAEVSRPDMPAILIEMFSHQNANDMAVALNPEFRFDVARATYKGILRFLSDRYDTRYVVQPLPPRKLEADFLPDGELRIRWEPTADPLEPTAVPNRYKVYKRIGNNGAFDTGTEVLTNEITIPLNRKGAVYSFRITALNEGGESFPSETLAAGIAMNEQGRALVVNGYDRLSGPAVVKDPNGRITGFDLLADRGVPYIQDRAIVGTQYDFEPTSAFVDNDEPGWGASSDELLLQGVPGNTFDYMSIHGRALLEAGYSFAGCSREAFEKLPFRPSQYQLVDVIMGEQRSTGKYTVFSNEIMRQMRKVTDGGVKAVISGSYLERDRSYTEEAAELFENTGRGAVVKVNSPLERMEPEKLTEFFVNLTTTD